MRYFYRDTNTDNLDNWEEISRKKAEDKIAATYGEGTPLLAQIKDGLPFNCSTSGGQILAEV